MQNKKTTTVRMGFLGFKNYVAQHVPSAIKKVKIHEKVGPLCDSLLIDGNRILHSHIYKADKSKKVPLYQILNFDATKHSNAADTMDSTLLNHVMHNSLREINSIINSFSPQNEAILVFDGSAPLAKLYTQYLHRVHVCCCAFSSKAICCKKQHSVY